MPAPSTVQDFLDVCRKSGVVDDAALAADVQEVLDRARGRHDGASAGRGGKEGSADSLIEQQPTAYNRRRNRRGVGKSGNYRPVNRERVALLPSE